MGIRRGHNNKAELFDHAGLIAINLGSDFVAEHEFGYDSIKQLFGIPMQPTRQLYGIDAYQITEAPTENLFLLKSPRKSTKPSKSPMAVLFGGRNFLVNEYNDITDGSLKKKKIL